MDEIENSCIQDFMQHAILLPRVSPVYKKILQVNMLPVDGITEINLDLIIFRPRTRKKLHIV